MLATIKLNRNNTLLRHLVWSGCTPPATRVTPLSSLLWGHFIWDKVSLCISNWHGTYYVDQAGLKLMKTLPSSPSRMLRLKVWTTIPGQRNTHYFLDQGISLLNMCYDFYPWLWLYKYVPPFANWPWVKHLWDAVDRERWMILSIPQHPCAELWTLGDASVLCVWLRRNCPTAISAGTPLKSPGKTWPWTAQLSAAEAKVEVCTVVKANSKLVQVALLQGNAWHISVSTPNLLHLTQSLMNHCHSINTCESAKVNGIRPRIEQCGMLHPLLLHSSADYPLLFEQQ